MLLVNATIENMPVVNLCHTQFSDKLFSIGEYEFANKSIVSPDRSILFKFIALKQDYSKKKRTLEI